MEKGKIYSKDKRALYSKKLCFTKTIDIMNISQRLLNVLRFVISLILYHYIETNDLDKYDDFLDCKDVKKKFF